MRSRIAALAGSLLFLACQAPSAIAQVAPTAVDEFGTQDGVDLWIPASSFTGLDGASWYSVSSTPALYFMTFDGGLFMANLPLPQGAFVDSWRAFFFDDSSTNDLVVSLAKSYDDITPSPADLTTELSAFQSAGTPGQTSHHEVVNLTVDYREPSGPGITRNQAADFYVFLVTMPADAHVGFKGVRVFWHRQVSPAPATATFNDVPTSDPAFQYIEALAASGITSGCNASPPMFCPDATLTRRQMAVFLSKALGLHWPPF